MTGHTFRLQTEETTSRYSG